MLKISKILSKIIVFLYRKSPIWAFPQAWKLQKVLKIRHNLPKTKLFSLNFVHFPVFRSYFHLFWVFFYVFRTHFWKNLDIFYYLVSISDKKHVICKGTIEGVSDNGLLYGGISHKEVFPDYESALYFKKMLDLAGNQ